MQNNYFSFIKELSENKDLKLGGEKSFKLIKDEFHLALVNGFYKEIPYEFVSYGIISSVSTEVSYKDLKVIAYSDGYKWNEEEELTLKSFLMVFAMHFENNKLSDELEHSYLIDRLTGLYNSTGVIYELSKWEQKRYKEYTSCFFNLKSFSLVNRTYGEGAGDQAIIEYAKKVSKLIHDDELFAHFGGDNFFFIVKQERAMSIINQIANMEVKIKVKNKTQQLLITATMGCINLTDDFKTAQQILTDSGMALAYTKSIKKSCSFLTKEIYNILDGSRQLEKDFFIELNLGAFIPYYQPKVDIRSGNIIGFEALARWKKNGKIVPPGMFVPVLEKADLISNLDLYILERVCLDVYKLREKGIKTVPISFNLSRRNLEDPKISNKILKIVDKYHIDRSEIIIEITESTALDEQGKVIDFVSIMRSKGFKTSIDDFGTGYSSFSAIRDFDVNEIKIDRSFINREKLVASDEIIIGSIINMANRLNIEVICEGVETEQQASFLERLGCYNIQGYLFDKPLSSEEFENKMKSGKYDV